MPTYKRCQLIGQSSVQDSRGDTLATGRVARPDNLDGGDPTPASRLASGSASVCGTGRPLYLRLRGMTVTQLPLAHLMRIMLSWVYRAVAPWQASLQRPAIANFRKAMELLRHREAELEHLVDSESTSQSGSLRPSVNCTEREQSWIKGEKDRRKSANPGLGICYASQFLATLCICRDKPTLIHIAQQGRTA